MKALLVVVLVSLCATVFAQLYSSVPGATDAAKQNNLYNAVRLARLWFKARICVVSAFRDIDPLDNNTIVNWAGWWCGYLGGPVNTSELCSYFYQGARNNNESQIFSDFNTTYGGNHKLNFNTSNAQFDTVSHALAYALAAVTRTPAIATTIINDFNTNLKSLVVSSAVAGNACPTPTYTLNWQNPASLQTNNVSDGDYVTWVWNDGAPHSLQSQTGGFTFPGIGGEAFSITRNDDCAAGTYVIGSPCVLEGLGSFNYTYQFFVPGGSALNLNYNCIVHSSGMTGNLLTNSPPSTSTGGATGGATTGADGTGVDDATSSIGSSASSLATWVSFIM